MQIEEQVSSSTFNTTDGKTSKVERLSPGASPAVLTHPPRRYSPMQKVVVGEGILLRNSRMDMNREERKKRTERHDARAVRSN